MQQVQGGPEERRGSAVRGIHRFAAVRWLAYVAGVSIGIPIATLIILLLTGEL